MLRVSVLLVLVAVSCTVDGARRFPPGARRRVGARDAPTATVRFYDQFIDHFNPESNAGTFKQRILYNQQYWGKSARWSRASCPGPIFFYTGNESPVTDYWSNSGFMTDVLAKEHGALIVFAEHRYFGQSMPFGNQSFANNNVGYLNPEQALADYATFLTDMKVIDRSRRHLCIVCRPSRDAHRPRGSTARPLAALWLRLAGLTAAC